MTEKTQSAAILRMMQDGYVVTAQSAARRFGCMRLAARVYDLRRSGVPVKSEMVYKRDKAGKVLRKWKRYYIQDARGGRI